MTNIELVSICFTAVWVINSKNIETARMLNELMKRYTWRTAPTVEKYSSVKRSEMLINSAAWPSLKCGLPREEARHRGLQNVSAYVYEIPEGEDMRTDIRTVMPRFGVP